MAIFYNVCVSGKRKEWIEIRRHGLKKSAGEESAQKRERERKRRRKEGEIKLYNTSKRIVIERTHYNT
jgi:hypothetical protein